MGFGVRLAALAAAATFCATLGLTGATSASAAATYTVKNYRSNMCLWANASIKSGYADQQACNSSLKGEDWTVTGLGVYTQVKNGFGQCLGEDSLNSGSRVFVTKCVTATGDSWIFQDLGASDDFPSGAREVQQYASELYLHVAGASELSGAAVNQGSLSDGDLAEAWVLSGV